MIHLGINPIGWSNDEIPELGSKTPLEICLREAHEAGFDGVEDIDRLMGGTAETVGLLLDACHATFAGTDPIALTETYASWIFHIHFKDVRRAVRSRAQAGDWTFLNAVLAGVFTPPATASPISPRC